MSETMLIFYLFLFLIIAQTTSSGYPAMSAISGDIFAINEPPSNTVSEIGNETIINCTTSNIAPHWTLSSDGATIDIHYLAISCVVQPEYMDHYRVDQTGGTTCNLIIDNTSLEQAGVYACSEIGIASALLTVIDPLAILTVHNQSAIVENDMLNISCSLTYNTSLPNAPSLFPDLYWTTASPNQTYESISYDTSSLIITSVVTITVKRPIIPIFTCHAKFFLSPLPLPPLYATNIPTNHYSWSTETTYDVLYPPESVCIIPSSPECWHPSLFVSCFASTSNPLANYVWIDGNSNVISHGQSLSVPRPGVYTCVAYINAGGRNHSANASVDISTTCRQCKT